MIKQHFIIVVWGWVLFPLLRPFWLLFTMVCLSVLSLVVLLASLGMRSMLILHAQCWQQALKHSGRALAIWEAREGPWFTGSYF